MITKLGKITEVYFGQMIDNPNIGIRIRAECGEGEELAVIETNHQWDASRQDPPVKAASLLWYISNLLSQAKVTDVNGLVGIPIEGKFRSDKVLSRHDIIDWRILEEVL